MLLSAALAAPPAFAKLVLFRDSTGRTELVDTANPGEHAAPPGPPMVQGKAGGLIHFNVTYEDVYYTTGYGFDDPTNGGARQAIVDNVLTYLNGLLMESGTCDLVFKRSQRGTSGPLAWGGTFFPAQGPIFTNGFAFDHITTNIDPDPAIADIELTFYFDWPFYADTGTTPQDQLDLTSVMLHEMSHGLGMISLTDANGVNEVSPGVMARWENLLYTGHGKKLWDIDTTFLGVPSDLTGDDGGVQFYGIFATQFFGGNHPPIYAPSSFQDGSSIGHWDETGVPAAVMKPRIGYGVTIRTYAPFELGALRDLGYTLGFIFTELPRGGWFEERQRLELRVGVAGATGAVTYQWKKDGVVVGATQDYVVDSLTLGHTGVYTCVVTDESKAAHETPPAYVTVFAAGSLPTTGIVGLCIVAVACVLAGAFIILRK
jgi:hypothetical protein